jgi:hypothetical protein
MEPLIILHTEPIRMAHMALAEDSVEALAEALAEDSVEALAEDSAEEDDGGKPENPALKAALEHQKSKAAASPRAREA